jgi:starch synthase
MPPTTSSGPEPTVLLAAPEVLGFAKTGGLADVAASLPRALARRGRACAVILPLYRSARTGPLPLEPTGLRFTVPVGKRSVPGRLWRSELPGSPVPVYLVEQPDYYERDDLSEGRGLYQFTRPDGRVQDYPDNCERFVFFCRAVLEAVALLDAPPDVLHLNDWETGLVPVYLREVYRRQPDPARRQRYARLRTLLTIHNVAYQGLFWHWDMAVTGLDWRLFNYRQLEFHGYLNFLKAGIVFADRLTTVSPTYAREIQTPYYGCGLYGTLAERQSALSGILNGIDTDVWDPLSDPHLPAHYDARTVREGKAACKAALQRELGLADGPGPPLLAMIARLVEQKGVDLVVGAAEGLLGLGCRLVVLGEGNGDYQERLRALRARHPGRVAVGFRFDEGLAHRIEAGADLFLMPSLYEPSGLNQLYSMRYGTVPVVRATGGLADTVVDCTPDALAGDRATGFRFVAATADALLETVRRALDLARARPDQWLRLQRCGMRQDWSWDRSAAAYEKLYDSLVTTNAD